MMTVETFLSGVGRQDFRKALGLPEQSLTRAVGENIMPSGWYIGAREFCAANGTEVPEHLFRWHGSARRDRTAQTSGASQ